MIKDRIKDLFDELAKARSKAQETPSTEEKFQNDMSALSSQFKPEDNKNGKGKGDGSTPPNNNGPESGEGNQPGE